MTYYLIALLLRLNCAWRVRRQQLGKRLLPCNILVLLCALMYAPYIPRSLNSPLPMHAFFYSAGCQSVAGCDTPPVLQQALVRWVNASLICGNPVLVTADRAVVVDSKMILK